MITTIARLSYADESTKSSDVDVGRANAIQCALAEQTVPTRLDHGLLPGGYVQLAHKVSHVRFDGIDAQRQSRRNLGVAATERCIFENFDFPFRQGHRRGSSIRRQDSTQGALDGHHLSLEVGVFDAVGDGSQR